MQLGNDGWRDERFSSEDVGVRYRHEVAIMISVERLGLERALVVNVASRIC